MHWLDTTLLAALSLGATLGFVAGLFWQVARITSFVFAIYATIHYHEPASQILREQVLRDADAGVIKAGAYLLVFLGTYLTLFLVAKLMRVWVRSTEMAPLDRLFGAVMGMAKVAIVMSAVCWILPYCPHPGPKDWFEKSTLAPIFARGLDAGLQHVPEEYKRPVLDGFRSWRDSATAPKSL